jgi:hypothetical protein
MPKHVDHLRGLQTWACYFKKIRQRSSASASSAFTKQKIDAHPFVCQCELGCSHRNNIKRRSRMKTMTLTAQDTLYLYSYYLCPHFHNDNANGVLLWAKMPNFQWTSISKCNNGLGITSKIKLMEYIHGENTLLCESSKCRKYTSDISIF